MSRYRILVVDDDKDFLDIFVRATKASGRDVEYEILTAVGPAEALDILASSGVDVVISDVMMPGDMDGYQLFREISSSYPGLPVILMTAYGSVEKAVMAVKEGAYHYFEKPIQNQEDGFWRVVAQAVHKKRLVDEVRREISDPSDGETIIGHSPAMLQVMDDIRKVAATPASVLIYGETGTGKELVAQTIHRLAGDRQAPFVAVNSAALPPTLLESELFGHTKGAFTGAVTDRQGLFERADGGTLFLDEVSELSQKAQAELLRVLDTQSFTPVGGKTERKVQVRVICATNKDLKELVDQGDFRRDLFYRLNVFPLHLPPLRERKEDIPLLVAHFLVLQARRLNLPVKTVGNEAMIFLCQYDWPGNIRELKNLIERGIIAAQGEEIGLKDLFPVLKEAQEIEPVTSLKEMERLMIRLALERCEGNKTAAAQRLGIGLKTLYQKIKRYGLG